MFASFSKILLKTSCAAIYRQNKDISSYEHQIELEHGPDPSQRANTEEKLGVKILNTRYNPRTNLCKACELF